MRDQRSKSLMWLHTAGGFMLLDISPVHCIQSCVWASHYDQVWIIRNTEWVIVPYIRCGTTVMKLFDWSLWGPLCSFQRIHPESCVAWCMDTWQNVWAVQRQCAASCPTCDGCDAAIQHPTASPSPVRTSPPTTLYIQCSTSCWKTQSNETLESEQCLFPSSLRWMRCSCASSD